MKFTTSLASAILILATVPVHAHSFTKGDIVVGHPWARATPGGATAGAGYAKITNKGQAPDRLISGSYPGAEALEIHEMKMDGDVMQMRQLKDGLEIPAGATVELKPGATHLMVTGLKKPIATGPDVKGTLTFEKAGAIEVEFRIEPVGAASSVDHKH